MQGMLFERNKSVSKTDRKELFYLIKKNANQKQIENYIKEKVNIGDEDINSYLLQFMTKDELNAFLTKNNDPTNAGNMNFYYGGISETEMFRLFVDVRKQRKAKENGFLGYEQREPGSIQAMYDAFRHIKDTIDTPLSAEYIKNIHRIAATKCHPFYTFRGFDIIRVPIKPGEFKDNDGASIGMENSSLSTLGILEMYRSFSSVYLRESSYPNSNGTFKSTLVVSPKSNTTKGYEEQIHCYLHEYQREVSDPALLNKIVAIVRLFQRLDRQHAFRDGNTRTYETLLLNRELVKHGFTPTLFEDPGRLIGHSLNESVYEVLRGMQNFRELKQNGIIEGCIPTDEILMKNNTLPITFK